GTTLAPHHLSFIMSRSYSLSSSLECEFLLPASLPSRRTAMPPPVSERAVRVLVETLRLSRGRNRVQIADIASSAKTSGSFARKALTNARIEHDGNWVSVNSGFRIRLALDIARAGRLRDSARALTWQEFEKFAEECLEEAGFQTEKNVRVQGDGRAWQIDVVGVRGDLVVTVDCKHWNTPGYFSRFRLAAEHQR